MLDRTIDRTLVASWPRHSRHPAPGAYELTARKDIRARVAAGNMSTSPAPASEESGLINAALDGMARP